MIVPKEILNALEFNFSSFSDFQVFFVFITIIDHSIVLIMNGISGEAPVRKIQFARVDPYG